MKKFLISAILSLFLILNINTNVQAIYIPDPPPDPLCAGDQTCNTPYTFEVMPFYVSDLCPDCHYYMWVWWRICPNPTRIDFQLVGGEVGDRPFAQFACEGCADWKELWKEGVKKVIEELSRRVPEPVFNMTFSNEACWKKIDGAGPAGVAGYIVAPCNTECCKYTYQVINDVVHLIQFEAPLTTCPPGDECFALCDPFGFFPPAKSSLNEINFDNMEVYPNPVNSILNIKLSNLEKGNYEIRVSNIIGQTEIYTEQQNLSETMNINLDVNKLTKGIYYFTVVFEKKIIKSGKFAVE